MNRPAYIMLLISAVLGDAVVHVVAIPDLPLARRRVLLLREMARREVRAYLGLPVDDDATLRRLAEGEDCMDDFVRHGMESARRLDSAIKQQSGDLSG
jgi:hypothetical protein